MAFLYITVCVLSYTYHRAYKGKLMTPCYSFLISFIHEVLLCRTKEISGYENASTHIEKFEFSSFLKMSVCGFVVTKVKLKKFRCQNESNLFFQNNYRKLLFLCRSFLNHFAQC